MHTHIEELLSITKLQNLKAIHNVLLQLRYTENVVINHKTIKFESNSQRRSRIKALRSCCYQSQNYKNWKQFTTVVLWGAITAGLLSITKLQNLKAIHNRGNCRNTLLAVVINRKTTKFESNSQQCFITNDHLLSCYQSQNYKIWKQFTTCCMLRCVLILLLSIIKLQNLKAIHNRRR